MRKFSEVLEEYLQERDRLTGELEKFVELIVRECLAHGKLTQSQTVVNGSEEYNAGREMGIEVFMNQIRKHFGVEGVDDGKEAVVQRDC